MMPVLNGKFKPRNFFIIAVLLLVFAFAMCNNIINSTVNSIIETFGLVSTSQGLASSLLYAGNMAALMVAVMTQGRVNKLWMMVIMGWVMIASVFVSGIARSFSAFIIMCPVLGAAGSFIDTYSNAYMADADGNDGAKYLGYLHGCYSLGAMITPLLVSAVMAGHSWRLAYVTGTMICAGIMIVFTISAVYRRRNGRHIRIGTACVEKKLSPELIKDFFCDRRFIALIAAALLFAVSQQGMAGWIVRYMTVRYNAEGLGNAALSVFWICVTLSRFLAPMMPLRPIIIYSWGIAMAGAALALGLISPAPLGMVAAIGIAGFMSGHCNPMLVSEITRGHAGATAFATSCMILAMGVARVITPLIMAYVTDNYSAIGGMLLPAAASVGSGVMGWLSMRAPGNEAGAI